MVHPDVLLHDLRPLRALGPRLGLENMNPGKRCGQQAEHLEPLFEQLPDAGFVLDISHPQAVDPSVELSLRLAKRFAGRLRHLHCSVIIPRTDEHWTPNVDDLDWIADRLRALPPVPRLWEQLPGFDAGPSALTRS